MFRNNKGFTVMELMIVVGLLTVVIAGMFGLFLQTTEVTDRAKNKTNAIFEAESKLEEIRNYSFDSILREYTCECSDYRDNDSDSDVDLDDVQCSSAQDDRESTSTTAKCNDGIDNDGDGSTDYGSDGSCDATTDDSENHGCTFALTSVNGSGTISITVDQPSSCTAPCDNPELLNIQIDASWTNKNGSTESITVESKLAER